MRLDSTIRTHVHRAHRRDLQVGQLHTMYVERTVVRISVTHCFDSFEVFKSILQYYAYPVLVIDTEKVCRRPASSGPRCRPTGALIIGAREIFMQSSPFCKSRPINMLLPLLALVGFAAGCGEQHPYARDIHHHENVDKREYPQFPLTPPSRPLEWGDLNVIHTTDTHGWLLGHQKTSWPEPNYR